MDLLIAVLAATAVLVLVVLLPQVTILKNLGPVLRTAIEVMLGTAGYLGCLLVFYPQPLQQMLQFIRRRKSEVLTVAA